MDVAWLALLAAPPALLAGWIGASHGWYVRWHRVSGVDAPRLGLAGFVAYHVRELVAYARIGWWHVRAFFEDGLRRPVRVSGPPVLFVHGFTQNGTNGWGLRRRLEGLGRPTVSVSLGRPFRSVIDHARPLHQRLSELADAYPEGIDIVAHSMGGVLLRHVLGEHPELARHVRRVVTLGSPHGGTAGTRGMGGDLHVDVAELAVGSAWIARLPDLATVAPGAVVTTVAAKTDLIVYPASTCHLPGARHVDLDGVGHAGLLAARRAHDIVVEALTAK